MNPIVMVHGAFVGGWSFEQFRRPFETAGHVVATPDLPGHAASEPRDAVLGLSISDYVDRVAEVCRGLGKAPILVGHSMGGLVAALAARRIEALAVVLLAPAPPWGLTGWSAEEVMGAFGAHLAGLVFSGVVEPSAELMRHFSLSRMRPDEAEAVLERMRPESSRALRETLNWWMDPLMTTSLGPGPLSAPSLVISGEADQILPPASGRRVAQRIGADFQIAAGMGHWLVGEPGWPAVAETVREWLRDKVSVAA